MMDGMSNNTNKTNIIDPSIVSPSSVISASSAHNAYCCRPQKKLSPGAVI